MGAAARVLASAGSARPVRISRSRFVRFRRARPRATVLGQEGGGRRPLMLVSDLDGTMVGDTAATDAATRRFRDWWEREQRPAGGQLVFSTGRTLAGFLHLRDAKGATLADPDLLVGGVGTRVYRRRRQGAGGGYDDACAFDEDVGWRGVLGGDGVNGWDAGAVWALLERAREVACAAHPNVDGAVHWRPPEELSSHKYTLGAADAAVDAFTEGVRSALAEGGLSARVVVSGVGGWRYVDVLPAAAGKRNCLAWVARELGFRPDCVVACGDSMNDADMLGVAPDELWAPDERWAAIAVGNAQPDLRKAVQCALGSHDRLVLAADTHADGILEGLSALSLA